MTQTEALLAFLRTHPDGITPLQALDVIGSFRLAARVWDLRDAGFDIRTESVSANGKTFARYRLVEGPEQLVAGW